jgi:hypothetical protein
MTITSAKVFFGSEGEWVDISDAIVATDFTFSPVTEDTSSLGPVHIPTNYTASFSFSTNKREVRRFITRLARMDRRPALIHNGGKPRV